MISVSQLKEKASRKYWTVLKAALKGETIFPLIVPADKKLPPLHQWVEENPKKILNYIDTWDSIVKVLLYFRDNPRPNMYTRELPINVHTMFIENNRGILRELLEYIIPAFIDSEGNTFEKQFHLKSPSPFICMRRLDRAIDPDIFALSNDLALPSEAFNRLAPRSLEQEHIPQHYISTNLKNS